MMGICLEKQPLARLRTLKALRKHFQGILWLILKLFNDNISAEGVM
jgi:hypothetical protein